MTMLTLIVTSSRIHKWLGNRPSLAREEKTLEGDMFTSTRIEQLRYILVFTFCYGNNCFHLWISNHRLDELWIKIWRAKNFFNITQTPFGNLHLSYYSKSHQHLSNQHNFFHCLFGVIPSFSSSDYLPPKFCKRSSFSSIDAYRNLTEQHKSFTFLCRVFNSASF